jgi:pimeloyl-[acyl-carrier protein] methyl ester esterase
VAEKLKIITRGEGPDLVLLHGWAMHSGIWSGLLERLAREYRVNLVDLPGHGVNRRVALPGKLAEVADLILSHLPPAVWVGWSLGGLVTLAAALRQPGMVRKAMLVAATPSFSKRPGWDCGVDPAAQRAFREGLQNNLEETLKQFWLHCFGAAQAEESMRLLGKTSVMDGLPDLAVLKTGLRLLYGNDLRAELKSCEVPALFLGGTRDRTILPESFTRAADLMRNARAHLVNGAGHAPFLSHPDGFLDMIHGFAQGENGT